MTGSSVRRGTAGSTRRWRPVSAAALWILAGVVYVLGEAVAASAFPGYNYATNYISDLGVPETGVLDGRTIDSPLHTVMNVAFAAHGVLFLLAAILAAPIATPRSRVPFVALASVHAVGIALVGIVSGGPVNAANGLGAVHVLGAAMAILGGNLTAIVGGAALRRGVPSFHRSVSVALGVAGVAAVLMLQIDSGSSAVDLLPDGVWERISVYTITAWEVSTGVLLLAAAASSREGAGRRLS